MSQRVTIPAVIPVLLATVVLICSISAVAWAETDPNVVKAKMVERLPDFVTWPASDAVAVFRVGVIGPGTTMFDALKFFFGKRGAVEGLPVSVEAIDENAALDQFHILFVSGSEPSLLHLVLQSTADRPVLIVSDADGFAEAGSHINFYVSAGKVRFEINKDAVELAGLQMSSRLMRMASPSGASSGRSVSGGGGR